MKNDRLVSDSFIDFAQTFEVQSCPVLRIYTVDVADACCQEVNTEVSNCLALCRVSQFAVGSTAVFCSADTAYFAFNGYAFGMSEFNDFL